MAAGGLGVREVRARLLAFCVLTSNSILRRGGVAVLAKKRVYVEPREFWVKTCQELVSGRNGSEQKNC